MESLRPQQPAPLPAPAPFVAPYDGGWQGHQPYVHSGGCCGGHGSHGHGHGHGHGHR